MKTTKNPSRYDGYAQGVPEQMTTATAAIAFAKLADIFLPGHGPVMAVAPAALPDVPLSEMIAEGIALDKPYQFELGAVGARITIGMAFQSFREGTDDYRALSQIFNLNSDQVKVALLAAAPDVESQLLNFARAAVDKAIAGDGGR